MGSLKVRSLIFCIVTPGKRFLVLVCPRVLAKFVNTMGKYHSGKYLLSVIICNFCGLVNLCCQFGHFFTS